MSNDNESTNLYTIYDEEGNIRGVAENEGELDVYRKDLDYNQDNQPPGTFLPKVYEESIEY